MGTQLDPPLPKGYSPQFPAPICYDQMAGWIKMPLGMEVGLGPATVRWGVGIQFPLLKKGAEPPPPIFRPMSVAAKRLDA